MVLIPHLRPRQWNPSLVEVALVGLCRVVASFFSAPGSGSPSPVEVAPAGLCRVVASFFSTPGSGSPSPVEVAPAGPVVLILHLRFKQWHCLGLVSALS